MKETQQELCRKTNSVEAIHENLDYDIIDVDLVVPILTNPLMNSLR